MTNFRTQNSTPNQSPYSYFDEERSQYHEFPPGFSYSQSLISQMVTMLREQKEETNELRKEVSTLNSEVTSVKQDLQHQLSSL